MQMGYSVTVPGNVWIISTQSLIDSWLPRIFSQAGVRLEEGVHRAPRYPGPEALVEQCIFCLLFFLPYIWLPGFSSGYGFFNKP